MFPTLTDVDLSTMDLAALRTLATSFRDALEAKRGERLRGDDLNAAKQCRADYDTILAEIESVRFAEEEAPEVPEVPKVPAQTTNEPTEGGVPAVGDEEARQERTEERPGEQTAEEINDGGDGGEGGETTASGGRAVRTALGAPGTETPAPRPTMTLVPGGATAGLVHAPPVKEHFVDGTQVANTLLEFLQSAPDPGRKHVLATEFGRFDDKHRLGESKLHNLQTLTRPLDEEEIKAAVCGPLTPTYALACRNNTSRPVYASLPGYQYGDRGGVTIPQSPSLADVAPEGIGVGIWTQADDANPNAVKNPCATIECSDPEEFRWYAIYRCMVIKNMMAMTNPELVEAYLNRLEAAQSRLGDVQLLEAMASRTTPVIVNAGSGGYGATVQILRALVRYRMYRREVERWDDEQMEVWFHRRYFDAIKLDLLSRKVTNGGLPRVPSDAEIRALFAGEGFNVHTSLDAASWMDPLPAMVNGANVLAAPPTGIDMVVAPRGKFRLMDQGTLNLGVQGNRIRDTGLIAENAFEVFFESFEGLVDTDSCPAHLLSVNSLCWNGAQTADVAVDCEGDDYAGIGS